MQTLNNTLTVGLVAHVDAGKTTLCEAIMFESGAIRRLGRVDHRDAFLDTDKRERERGITIFSKQARLNWKGLNITLTDTPGHVDFSSETERAMSILDCAVLVINASDKVQAHTVTIWRLLAEYKVPTFFFINKMDQPGTDRLELMREINSRLDEAAVDMLSDGAGEKIALTSEDALSEMLDTGEVTNETVSSLVMNRRLFPCYFGSALKNSGVDALLDGLFNYTEQAVYPDEFSARVYKISRDGDARLTWMKITGGTLHVRDAVSGVRDGVKWEEKVAGIRLYSGAKFSAVDEVRAGAVCAVTGLSAACAGDGIGINGQGFEPVLQSVFAYRMLPPRGVDPVLVMQKLRILEEEDPELRAVWIERTREIRVQIMGEVQKDIIAQLMLERFGMSVTFSEGKILYRETIAAPAIGVGHYEPLKHYAEVRLLLEPGPRGSGMRFCSACSEDVLERSWQRLILTHLGERRHAGVLTGSPITDIKITLLSGRAHLKHTEGGDFRQATYRAVRQGLMSAQSILLEPWFDLNVEVPADCVGRAMTDIGQMGGSVSQPEPDGELMRLKASAPVAKARYYARDAAVYTRGRGRVTTVVRGYEPCGEQEKIVAEFMYDPERDTANPADSVFCSHGAGYSVNWRDAPKYMHIIPEREYKPAEAEKPAKTAEARKADEAELSRIFERTYGPVKQFALRPTPKDESKPMPVAFSDPIPESLLVDGYNIIFAWDELKSAANESLEDARHSLMDILSNYQGFKTCDITLVFDAYRVADHAGSVEDYKNLRVVYTKQGETADQYIEKTVYELKGKRRVRVATSDRLEQFMVLGDGALRISARELHADVKAANVEISAILEANSLRSRKTRNMEAALRDAVMKKRIIDNK